MLCAKFLLLLLSLIEYWRAALELVGFAFEQLPSVDWPPRMSHEQINGAPYMDNHVVQSPELIDNLLRRLIGSLGMAIPTHS